MDFEKAARKACKEEFNIVPSGCLFHLIKCWLRKAGKLGHSKKEDRSTIKNLIFYLTCFAFVSPEKVFDNFQILKSSLQFNTALSKILSIS